MATIPITSANVHLPATPARPGGRGLPLAERHGGWILAVALHVMFFAWLMMQAPVVPLTPAKSKPETVELHLEPELAPQPTPEPPPQPSMKAMVPVPSGNPNPPAEATPEPEPPAPEPAQEPVEPSAKATKAIDQPYDEPEATSEPAEAASDAVLDPDATDRMLFNANTGQPAEGDAEATPEPGPTPEPTPDPEETLREFSQKHAETLAQLRKRAGEMQRQNKEEGEQGSSAIANRLRMAQSDLTAQQTLYHDPIMNQGVYRTIDLSDVDMDKAQEILGRYGIKILYFNVNQNIEGADLGGSGYLGSAKTRSGVFVQPKGIRRGTYQAFTYGQIAERRMAQLEEDALEQRHLDPDKTRVLKVVFGIVSTTKGQDLGIKQIETAPVPESKPTPEPGPAIGDIPGGR